MIPATVQRCRWETECRQWDTDKLRRVETGTSQYDLRKIISLLCKDQKVTREKQLGGLEEGHEETAEVRARRPAPTSSRAPPAAPVPTSTTTSSRAAPRRPATTHRTGSSGSRQTDRECVVGQADWYKIQGHHHDKDRKPSLPRLYYFLTYRWQNTFSWCNRITKQTFYKIFEQNILFKN